jgi:mannose/fructose/N-acetylgalactosamine-specific phosphotransferase system component IIB
MQVQLFRIDDRLIHGQVVLGWAKYLGSDLVILCDDEVAQNDWEKELYLSCVPNDLEARIMNIRDASDFLNNGSPEKRKIIVLIKSPATLRQFIESGYIPERVNIGGMHYGENRKKILPYVFLSDEDISDLKVCHQKGISIYCQDVPNAKIHSLTELFDVE